MSAKFPGLHNIGGKQIVHIGRWSFRSPLFRSHMLSFLSCVRMNDKPIISPATEAEFEIINEVINDAAIAYKGVIPDDVWHEPYMPKEELRHEMKDGVRFYCYHDNSVIEGVMGIQDKGDVNLIRHAYVKTNRRGKGVGGALLEYLMEESGKPVLVGTWKAAVWAIRFYEKHGFVVVPEERKTALLRKYWNVPERQIETSVVLADGAFMRR